MKKLDLLAIKLDRGFDIISNDLYLAYEKNVKFVLNYHKPLSISKTKSEWKIIQKKIDASDKSCLRSYIQSEIIKLKESFDSCPDCYKKKGKVEKRPYIPINQYRDIQLIANKMKMPVSTVIDIFIIQPLLKR